jgi:hypothetical protein
MNSLKAYGSDSSSSDDDSDHENDEQRKLRDAEKTYHLKAPTSTMLVVRLVPYETKAMNENARITVC